MLLNDLSGASDEIVLVLDDHHLLADRGVHETVEFLILRMLGGTANQREIGAALYLSINIVKGYAKSLYRKLDVTSRQEAVDRARELGLI